MTMSLEVDGIQPRALPLKHQEQSSFADFRLGRGSFEVPKSLLHL